MFNYTGNYIGRVVDNNDPKKEGRIKVSVFSLFDNLESENIPWAYPSTNITGGSYSGGGFLSIPKIGSTVRVQFEKGNIYKPYWYFQEGVSDHLKRKLSDEFYLEAHSLIYDQETNTYLYKTKEDGFVFKNAENSIIIKEGSVKIKQIVFKEKENQKFPSDYVEGEDFPEEELEQEEVSDRTENEFLLDESGISINRYIGGKDNPQKINSIKITDDKITAEVNGRFIDLTELSISLGKLGESEFHAVLFEKLQEWQEELINKIGALKGVSTPSGPTLDFKTAVNWTELESLKSKIKNHKSENVTLIK